MQIITGKAAIYGRKSICFHRHQHFSCTGKRAVFPTNDPPFFHQRRPSEGASGEEDAAMGTPHRPPLKEEDEIGDVLREWLDIHGSLHSRRSKKSAASTDETEALFFRRARRWIAGRAAKGMTESEGLREIALRVSRERNRRVPGVAVQALFPPGVALLHHWGVPQLHFVVFLAVLGMSVSAVPLLFYLPMTAADVLFLQRLKQALATSGKSLTAAEMHFHCGEALVHALRGRLGAAVVKLDPGRHSEWNRLGPVDRSLLESIARTKSYGFARRETIWWAIASLSAATVCAAGVVYLRYWTLPESPVSVLRSGGLGAFRKLPGEEKIKYALFVVGVLAFIYAGLNAQRAFNARKFFLKRANPMV